MVILGPRRLIFEILWGLEKCQKPKSRILGGAPGRVNRDLGTLSWVCLRGFDLEGRLARPRGLNLEDFGHVFR